MRARTALLVVLWAVPVAACGDSDDDQPTRGFCVSCVGINTAPPDEPPDPVVFCATASAAFECTCTTESGATETLRLNPVGCDLIP